MIKDGTDTRGERNGMSRLTVEDVRHIRELRAAGATNVDIALGFGVTPGTIAHINTGKTWSWLT